MSALEESPPVATLSRSSYCSWSITHKDHAAIDRVSFPQTTCAQHHKVHLAVLNSLECECQTPDDVLCDKNEVWEEKLSQGDTNSPRQCCKLFCMFAKELACQRAALLRCLPSISACLWAHSLQWIIQYCIPKCCRGWNKLLFTLATESAHCTRTTARVTNVFTRGFV